MEAFDRDALLARRAELVQMQQDAANEFQRLTGAIQLCDALLAELDRPEDAPKQAQGEQQ